MKYNLTERQYHIIIETNKIQPFYKVDATGKEINPENPLQRNDIDFGAMRDFEDSHGIKAGDTTKHLRQVQSGGLGADIIKKLQDELTKIAQRRRAKETGGDGKVIPRDEIGTISPSIEDKVKNGLPLELKGKSFSFGNMKVPEDVMIINLTSAMNCPAAKAGECPFTDVCYARMEEKGPMANLQLRNLRNQHMYKYLSGKEILKLIETYIEQAPVRIKYIRISEDGDFPDQDTLNFCDKLAGHIKAKYGIQTAAYTHRQLDYSGVKNIIINASDYRIKNATRYFICTDKESWSNLPEGMSDGSTQPGGIDTSNGVFKCHCDCRKCYFCYKTKEQNGEPEGPLTVVEELRGDQEKVGNALDTKNKLEKKCGLDIPACSVEVNKKKKVRKKS
jgi:hypothetical protein